MSPKQLLSTIESTLLGPGPPSPSQRIELIHAIRRSLPSFQSFLSYPPPKPSDRTQVQSKEVRLPEIGPIPLDDQDVQIALKLSDDLHLNEIDCVVLLVAANQEWGFVGREPLEILRLSEGLWYTERRDLLTALYSLLRAVVLDQGLDVDLVVDIQKYLEDLLNAGLRQRLISLIKELNREEPAGLGGPNCENCIIDSRGAVVERQAVVSRERLIIGHCIVLSVLVVRISPKDVKDIFSVLKDSATELNDQKNTIKHQITYSLLFSLIIAFISDALGAVPDKESTLSHDSSFRHGFQEIVMASGNDSTVEGFVDCVRFSWSIFLMLTQDGIFLREGVSSASSNDLQNIYSCLRVIFSNNVFQFFLDKIFQTAAYQNDDEDMVYMYNAYLHKLVACFLSHPLALDKLKEAKEKAMAVFNPYRLAASHDYLLDGNVQSQPDVERVPKSFISFLEFVSGIYEREPELLSGNDVLWTFVNFAGEDHTNFQTLVAFLRMLSTLASSQEGASRVFELLNTKTFRSIGWSTLFDCLSIYEEKFKQSLQIAGSILPEFQEGDAKALVAYLNVLQKVVANGNPTERKNWFPDIESLFKILSYENVPPYLKGALRNAITTFVQVSPILKDTIWTFLEQYDLPVVVGQQAENGVKQMAAQVYDMQYELNEIEARREQYPSTISFLNLLNALIVEERDVSDRGRRFIGIFRFIYDHVFSPFPQRAYADPCEKWPLVIACLQHFKMMLSMYEIKDEDVESVVDQFKFTAQSSQLQMQLPVIELLKDFMSGRTLFRNIMGIILPGANFLITERTTQSYGQKLETAVLLSLEIIILVLEKDLVVSDFWRPIYQPVHIILSQDHTQIVSLLEYARYDFNSQIQQCSIKIMSILSSRMSGLVHLLLKLNAANSLIEDYAACLELRLEECQAIDDSDNDLGVLIMQLLVDNISRPAPNIAHLLLKFDLDTPVERTFLQPKFHYSCLKIILDMLDNLSKPEVNALVHEFGFQLLYELCLDPLTCNPMMDLLSGKKYQFFIKHLDTIGVAPLPKRNCSQPLRISSLHQRAWLLKLLTVELHTGDVTSSNHRETCENILAHVFGQNINDCGPNHAGSTGTGTICKSKALELLEVIQFRSPDTNLKPSQVLSSLKYGSLAEGILVDSSSGKKDVYYHSERGDRLIDLTSFRDKLWQKFNSVNPQLSSFGTDVELSEIRDTIQQLLRWGWKYNRSLEEQAAQLHMLSGWSQIVEISISRKSASFENLSEILFLLLDASLSSSGSPDCSLKMAFVLTQVALTCMAKLRDESFLCPSSLNSDTITCLDVLMMKQLSNSTCHSILFKLIIAFLRRETSESLRRRQYALLLSYFQYCQHLFDPNVPISVIKSLIDVQDSDDLDLLKIDKDHTELFHANFVIIRKEAQSILDLIIKDATQGSESGKVMSLYVLDALISIDHEKFFLNQLQSRGFLRSCLTSISNVTCQDGGHSLDLLQHTCTLEAELALLLRISHKYGKAGSQILFSMDALEHVSSCCAITMHVKGGFKLTDVKLRGDLSMGVDKQQTIVASILRFVFSLTLLVDTSDFFEVKNKVVRGVLDFVKGQRSLFDLILRKDPCDANELAMEQIKLLVGILCKVWPYEESDESGFLQSLFQMIHGLFSQDIESLISSKSKHSFEDQRKSELDMYILCISLSSYLYYLITKKSVQLQVSERPSSFHVSGKLLQPTLTLLSIFLDLLSRRLERAAEEKSILLSKIQDINELSRQEVDEVINMYVRQDCVSSSDNIQKRRYIAMVNMCHIAGSTEQIISLLLLLAENILNILLFHIQNDSYTSDIGQATKKIDPCTTNSDTKGLTLLCEKLFPTLERFELLSEEKLGHNLKVFYRLVTSLKEKSIRSLEV